MVTGASARKSGAPLEYLGAFVHPAATVDEAIAQGRRFRVDAVVQKPVDAQQLCDAILASRSRRAS